MTLAPAGSEEVRMRPSSNASLISPTVVNPSSAHALKTRCTKFSLQFQSLDRPNSQEVRDSAASMPER